MDEFDPVPKLNPVAKGLLSAFLIMALVLCVYGGIALSTAVLVGTCK